MSQKVYLSTGHGDTLVIKVMEDWQEFKGILENEAKHQASLG